MQLQLGFTYRVARCLTCVIFGICFMSAKIPSQAQQPQYRDNLSGVRVALFSGRLRGLAAFPPIALPSCLTDYESFSPERGHGMRMKGCLYDD